MTSRATRKGRYEFLYQFIYGDGEYVCGGCRGTCVEEAETKAILNPDSGLVDYVVGKNEAT